MKKRLLLTVGIMVLVACTGFRTKIKVVEYNIKSDKIKENIKIAFVADLHSCDYGDNQKELVDEIFAKEPDMVFLGGDIVDDRLPRINAKQLFSIVGEKYPSFYVSGNHEYRGIHGEEIKEMVEGYDIEVLEGESIAYEVNGQNITIGGVDDPQAGEERFKEQLKNCGDNIDENQLSILLSHRPELVDSYASYGFDLVLSGHAHGGQWRIPGILNGLIAPNQGLFPKYAGGFYEVEDTQMIVSRGLARESTKVPRIFNPPELVIVNIIPGE